MNLHLKMGFWTSKKHWQWATDPNSREKASFLKENITTDYDRKIKVF